MSRTYDQYCPVARALELVGERWTLLVARELLLGPRRFTDLMAGLPGISANVLAGRLKDLEQEGMVARRTLPPPAASAVYELTPEAAGLVSVLAAMAEWGMTMLGEPRAEDDVHGEWIVLGLAVTAPAPDVADGTMYSGGTSMANLIRAMMPAAGRTIVDRTGLEGFYNVAFRFQYMPRLNATPSPDDPPNVFTAVQEQLGMKLESSKSQAQVLVVDHIERPSED